MKPVVLLITLLCSLSSTLTAKTSAVIEETKRHMYIYEHGQLTITEFKRILILDQEGYRHAIYQDYYNSFKKIKSLRYTVYDAANKKVKRLTKSDAFDVMFNPTYHIDDTRVLTLDPQYRNFPFAVEIEVETAYNGFLGFPVWMPRYAHDLEVRSAEMTLECFQGFEFASKEINGVNPPEIRETEKGKTARWLVKDLPAIENHISYKSFVSNQAAVHVAPLNFVFGNTTGSFTDWSEFGQWYHALNEGRNSLSSATRQFLDSLRRQSPNDESAISREVYKFMQEKTRYVSIQLGIGGFQTIPSDEVERTGYGDCKALTNYMSAMLRYLGIACNHVLVNAGSDVPDILHDFPSNQFNHVFLAVPMKKDTLWFECTSQTAPPAYTGTFTDDRYVLWIDKDHSKIIRSPRFGAKESVMVRNCTVKLNPNGDAQFDLGITQSGMYYDEAMYYQNLPKDKIESFNYNKFTYKDFTLQSFGTVFPQKDAPILGLNYQLKVNNLGKPLGTKMIIPSNVLPPLEKSLVLDVMNKKVEIRRSFTIIDSVQIIMPESYRIGQMPEPGIGSSEFGTFEIRFTEGDDSTLYIYRNVMIRKGSYEDETFKRFYEMVQKVKAIEHQSIVLQSKT